VKRPSRGHMMALAVPIVRSRCAKGSTVVSVHVEFEPVRADWLTASVDPVPVDLAEVWSSLVRGACVVAEGFFTDESCGLILSTRPSQRAPLDGRPLGILESILCGHSQNCVSIDLGLSPATIALSARVALEQLGVMTRPSRVHPLLMLAASAGRHPQQIFASETAAVRSAGSFRVIEVPRPERGLESVFPKASLDVLRRLVEGQCYAAMAGSRGTSERTIANQVSAIFRRLRVSGRNELVHRLFRSSGMLPPTGAEPRGSQIAGEERPRSCKWNRVSRDHAPLVERPARPHADSDEQSRSDANGLDW
jgi:DNA-binding NarL/FixJ family response regulator